MPLCISTRWLGLGLDAIRFSGGLSRSSEVCVPAAGVKSAMACRHRMGRVGRSRTREFLAALLLFPIAGQFLSTPVFANCVTLVLITTCDTAGLFTATVGIGPATPANSVLNLLANSQIVVGNANAISLADGANITLGPGAIVQATSTGTGGLYGTGGDTVEFRNNSTLTVAAGAQILSLGTAGNSEAINPEGSGNLIVNNGTIRATNAAAIFFQNTIGLNTVVNNATGIIQTSQASGNVIGGFGAAAVDFTNRGTVIGNLNFGGGNDVLRLFTGSTITGNFDGGGGTNSIFLNGTGSDSLPGQIKNFQTLTKTDTGTWTLTGSVVGVTVAEVQQGTLILTGNNSQYTGSVIVDPAGTLQGFSGSFPPTITDNGLVLFAQPSDGTYAGIISGAGSVTKTSAGALTLTGLNTYSGGTNFNQGVVAVGADTALGAASGGLTFNGGTLRFNTSFNLAPTRAITLNTPGGTFDTQGFTSTIAQSIGGAGALTKMGAGTLTLTAANSYGGGTTVAGGTLQLTNPAAAGPGGIQVNGGTRLSLLPTAGAGFVLNNAFTGTGTVFAKMGAAADTFAFGAGAGTAFAGTAELADGKFALAGTNTAALTSATLQLDANNTTTVGAGTQAIGGLTMNGGKAIFATTVPSDTVSPANISTGALTLTSGQVQVIIANPATPPSSFAGPGSPSTLLQQDDGVLDRLVSATSVSGSAGGLTLLDQNGAPVPASLNVPIAQGGNTVAVGSYGYGLTSGPANNGLYVSYGLTQLNLQTGQTLTLSGDDGTPAGSELHARIIGPGNLVIDATNTIRLNNSTNTYTGTTTVGTGTLALGANGALGQSSNLIVNPGTSAILNGTTQTIGALDIGGTLDLALGTLSTSAALGTGALTTHPGSTVNINGGSLNIANGGTTAPGSLTGGGSLNLAGGTLNVSGANPGLTASTAIASGATAMLNDGGGLGSGAIANNGALIFNAATGTFVNTVTGTGAVSLTNGSNVIATGAIDSGGPKTIDSGSTLQLGNGGTTGSILGNITNNGSLLFDRSDVATYSDVISGAGSVSQIGSGTTILNGNNTYTGGTTINAGTLAIGDANNPGAVLSGGGPIQVAAGGTLGGYGSVTGNVTNAGTIGVGNTLAALSGGSTGNFTINGNVTNAGLAQIGGIGTTPGNALTIAGNYIGQNGTVALNTQLGGDGSPSDQLIISHGSATGSSGLNVTNVGGVGAITQANGIQVIQAINGATTAPGAFTLSAPAGAGPYEYFLYHGGETPGTADNWYLRTTAPTPTSSGTPTPAPGTPFIPAPIPGEPEIPFFRPEIAIDVAVPAVARDVALSMLGTADIRNPEPPDAAFGGAPLFGGPVEPVPAGAAPVAPTPAGAAPIANAPAGTAVQPGAPAQGKAAGGIAYQTTPAANGPSAVWGRFIGQSHSQRWTGTVNPEFNGRVYGLQFGLDLYRIDWLNGQRDRFGAFMGYARENGDVHGSALGLLRAFTGRLAVDGLSIGTYWTHTGPSGWHIDATLMDTALDTDARSYRPIETTGSGNIVTASLEGGYPVRIVSQFVLEPQAQLVWQHLSLGHNQDQFSTLSYSTPNTVSGRVGLRLSDLFEINGHVIKPFITANLWRTFSGRDTAIFATTPIITNLGATSLETNGGMVVQLDRNLLFQASAGYVTNIGGNHRRGVTGNAELKVFW
ncbi:autotransporter-associated beta strand repeat-containing protein [Rhizobiales bacterium GAS188]|nr:autotransporter-associated beta strand repeat-containing protein [Rhizobiales bacterium GAS188]